MLVTGRPMSSSDPRHGLPAFPPATSHRITSLSRPADASVLPSGLNATLVTSFL